MYDIFYIGSPSDTSYKTLKQRFPAAKYAESVVDAKNRSLTKFLWIVYDDIIIQDDFKFDYKVDQWSEKYTHVFLNGEFCDGIALMPKNSHHGPGELQTRFYINKKFVDILASRPKPYELFYIDTYEEYKNALENSKTEMFWMSTYNISHDTNIVDNFYISHHNSQLKNQTHAFIHRVDDNNLYNGLFLCSKQKELSKREIEYRFPVNRIEHDIVGSGPAQYDVFKVDTYEEYKNALSTSKTEMFWSIPSTVNVLNEFKFDLYFTHDNKYDRSTNHVFLNGKYHDGIILCSKYAKISQREWYFKFIAKKKEHNILASTPKPYDIVFISYQEPNANENFEKIMNKFPDRVIHRVHGIKGIHQAHIEAAKVCNTDMCWIVDGDAEIVEDFKFEYQVPRWQHDHVHVWRSKNPINGLVYGYGGVKLFPRQLTIDMDTSKPDMTTSISGKFQAIKSISNITAFNTGEFETWKSAFRECCKLSSKVIDRQKDDETEQRLKIWCTVGKDKPYGEYALSGARAGMAYGSANKGNIEALKMINDFDWLKEKFDGNI